VELKKQLTEVFEAVMTHLSEEPIFFHGAVVGGALRRHVVVAFPHAPLFALVIVIFADKEMPVCWLKNARFCIGHWTPCHDSVFLGDLSAARHIPFCFFLFIALSQARHSYFHSDGR
jgi:hypothetical protein